MSIGKIVLIIGAAVLGSIGLIAHEVGVYSEEINPFNNISKDIGADFDCDGCMAPSYNPRNCENCKRNKETE